MFTWLEQQHNTKFEAQIDQDNYDESALVSIKTAISIPYGYLNKSDKFERWKGEIEINGVQYKCVKRRFFSDSIELLCIPNITATKLKEAKQDYSRLSNDFQSDQGKKQDQGKVPVFKNLLSEYCEDIREWEAAMVAVQQSHYSSYSLFTSQYIGDTPAQPPDFV